MGNRGLFPFRRRGVSHRSPPAIPVLGRGLWVARWVAPWVALWVALWAGFAGCAGSGLAPVGGGLPPDEAARISLAVAQTRAQFPQQSGGGIPHQPRDAPPVQQRAAAGLVLRGAGVEVRPGIQRGARSTAQVEVYLAKPGYRAGRVEISLDGGAKQTWPIVAYDHRGDPEGVFEFLYLLASPQGAVRYLAVIGGPFRVGQNGYFGLEGTWIEPGGPAGAGLWQSALKLDFGFRFPHPPGHAPLLDEAERIFRVLPRGVSLLTELQQNLKRAEAELSAAQAAPAGGAQPQPRPGGRAEPQPRPGGRAEPQPPPGGLAEKAAQARQAFQRQLDAMEKALLRYYRLRERIAEEFAGFAASNYLAWMPARRQQAFFDQWQSKTRHHPKIDEMTDRVRLLLEKPGVLDAARTQALGAVRRHANQGRDPSRAPGATP